MATDKLINQTQGADIIDALSDIATNVGNITYGPQTSADKVVSMTGYQKASTEAAISQGDTLNEAIGKLEKKADNNATSVASKIDKLTTATAGDIATVTATGEIADSAVAIETTLSDTSDAKVPTSKAVGTYVEGKGYAVGVNSSTANNLVSFNSTDGKALKDSGIAVANSTAGLADSDTAVPTSKTVKTYVDSTATGISRYLGTITAASGLSTDAKKGDFYIVKTAWTGVHVGDEIIAEKNSPAQTIDGTNWSLLHNEADTDTKYTFATGDNNGTFKVTPSDTGTAQSVSIKGLGNAAYKGVADTVSTSADLVTSAAVNTKLASYVPNSDFVVAENNIVSILDADGQKNILYYEGLEKTEGGLTFKYDADGTITVNGTCSVSAAYAYIYGIYGYVTQGVEYSLIDPLQNNTNGCYAFVANADVFGDARTLYSHETHYTSAATRKIDIVMRFANGSVYNNVQLKPMICIKSLFDISSTYFPPSKSNSDLTYLQAEDRAELINLVDNGAKNLFNIFGATESKTDSVTRTINSDGTITVSNDGTNTKVASLTYTITLNANTQYIISGCPSGGSDNSYSLSIRNTGHQPIDTAVDYGSGSSAFTVPSFGTYLVFIRIAPNYSFSNKVFKPMICTKTAFSISQKFVLHKVDKWSTGQFFSNSSNNSSYTFTLARSANRGNRYRYGMFMIGEEGTPPSLFSIFIDTSNNVTIAKMMGTTTATFTATVSWDTTETGTLSVTANNTIYGGIRGIWFD